MNTNMKTCNVCGLYHETCEPFVIEITRLKAQLKEARLATNYEYCDTCGGAGMTAKYDPRDVRNAPPALRDAIMENAAEIYAGSASKPSPFTALEGLAAALNDSHLLFRRIARKAVAATAPNTPNIEGKLGDIEELARHGIRILESVGVPPPSPLRDEE